MNQLRNLYTRTSPEWQPTAIWPGGDHDEEDGGENDDEVVDVDVDVDDDVDVDVDVDVGLPLPGSVGCAARQDGQDGMFWVWNKNKK